MTNTKFAKACVIFACEDLKIPIVPVEFVDSKVFTNENITAMFLPEQNIILFNYNWLSTALQEEIAVTAFHESRHAYQKYSINNFLTNNQIKDYKKIVQWKNEFDSYQQPTFSDTCNPNSVYLNLSIEKDAIDWSQSRVSDLLSKGN